MEELRTTVRNILDTRFCGSPPPSQIQGTAFAAALTLSLAPVNVRGALLFGNPRTTVQQILNDWGIEYEPEEFLVDFTLISFPTPTRLTPVLGCESEMYPGHGVEYSFNREGPCRANGYVFDFRKLLMFQAPSLLFAARLVPNRIARLERTLDQCAKEYCSEWRGRRIHVVLMPSSRWEEYDVRIGTDDGHELVFDDLTTGCG
jgi:hypothetical protein